jgi:hypothetical protein
MYLNFLKFFKYQQQENNGKESRKHLKLREIFPTAAELVTGNIAKQKSRQQLLRML